MVRGSTRPHNGGSVGGGNAIADRARRTGGNVATSVSEAPMISAMREIRDAAKSKIARTPVPIPNAGSTWEQELWQLQRLYSGCGDFSTNENDNGDRIVCLTHHCTDPDWEAVNWSPEGLSFEIQVCASYPDKTAVAPTLLVIGPTNLPERFVQLVPLLFAESATCAPPHSPAIYRALQHVDRHLTALWLKVRAALERAADEQIKAEQTKEEQANAKETCDTKPEPNSDQNSTVNVSKESNENIRPATTTWTAEEQALLESALLDFREETDVKRRWNLIAQRVGGGRTARDCAARFRSCRDIALGQPPSDNSDSMVVPKVAPAPTSAAAWSAEDVRRLGVEVRLLGLSLEGFDTLLLQVLRLQCVCDRCKKPTDIELESNGTNPSTTEIRCPVCKQDLAVRLAPSICHAGCTNIAHVLGVNCHPTQLLRSDFHAACGECTEKIRVRNFGPGYRKRAECANCFTKLNLAVEGAEVIGVAVAQWRHIAENEGARLNARKQLQEARRHERELGIKVGHALPEKGTCKHFQKSYRWFRFPCCGRAFPCDACHDEQMDHVHEWANRMLCGHCSHEQPFNHDKCIYCGASQTRSKTSYWEGGEGCRNTATMSKKDPHKYKGLGKSMSNAKATKCNKS